MKKFFFIAAMILLVSSISAQESKSTTQSALCNAQDMISNYLINKGFHGNSTLDIGAEYDSLIIPILVKCLADDIYAWGSVMESDAKTGKYKKIPLTFEKPEGNEYFVPKKAIKQYKKLIASLKKEFFTKRKDNTVTAILSQENLETKLKPVAKTLKDQFLENIKKASE